MYYPLARQTQHNFPLGLYKPSEPFLTHFSMQPQITRIDRRGKTYLPSLIFYTLRIHCPALMQHFGVTEERGAITFLNLNCCSLRSQTFFNLLMPLTCIQLQAAKTLKPSAYQLLLSLMVWLNVKPYLLRLQCLSPNFNSFNNELACLWSLC